MNGLPDLRVAVAMLGARRHYAVPRLLHEAGLLDRFFTDSYLGNKPWLEAALRSIPPQRRAAAVWRWLGRKDDVLPPERVTSFEGLGIWYAYARLKAKGRSAQQVVAREAAIRFNRSILKHGLGGASVVWGFNGAALELLKAAKGEGRICILEQTILPQALERRLLSNEQARWPGWEEHPTDWSQALALDGREEAEWELADAIVAGSDFVRDGLIEIGVAAEKIHVIPYGVDPSRFVVQPSLYPYVPGARPLRVLFAGSVGLRKGIPDLLHALRLFRESEIEARVAGAVSLADNKLAPFGSCATFLGPVPRLQMNALFQWADVFVLPSLVEGSAIVTYEAIMSGCPVIVTRNAGTVIRDGTDGFVVPVSNPERLAAALRRYLDEPGLLQKHRGALSNTRAKASLARYKEDLVSLIRRLDMSRN